MSDLCMYQPDNPYILGDSNKKPRLEVTKLHNTKDKSSMRYANQGRELKGLSSAESDRRNTMLEKDSWSHSPCGAFLSSSDSVSIKKASSAASENTALPISEKKTVEFDANDTLLGDKTSAMDKSLSYPISDVSYTGNNFDFSENTEDKDSSDLLYYDLPEIENFEDVDKMFRSCDSTFGLGADKEDELGWLASADNIEGSGGGLRHDFRIPCPEASSVEKLSQGHGSSTSSCINDSAANKGNSWALENSDSCMYFVNGPPLADKPEGHILNEQIGDDKKQFNLQDQNLGKINDPYFMNGGFSFINNQPNEMIEMASEAILDQALMQKQAPSSDSSNYVQNPLSLDNSHNMSGLTSVFPTLSPVKSENNDIGFHSPRDSSRASNHLKFMESSKDPKFQVTAVSSGRREKLHSRQGSRSSASSNLKKQSATSNMLIGKQVNCYGDKVENHSDIEGVNLVIPGHLGSSGVQESSTISSGVDDVSLEAASFHQLQLVMEQLDLRTKLCIRDSLYRLARSAEQRHNRGNIHGGGAQEPDAAGPFIADGTNNFMDMETDTNPIDRSIAHLLFHRPSESSAKPAPAFKSPNAVRGSIAGAPLMVENSAICEEAASDAEKKISGG
ncbi:protein LNK1 isoform X2 [Andrographis paniculata]|uniref:protein LNK1 isoform X2 n=1 Tax=Andrographis paniculata TaxID=175694 RepID=UPI0021E6E38A|nr:protein LNK1 isoform X2 [Andrographis paniculata]XP_051147129.1 protein LNK1 isoform X2 [Andrographis paniculata]